MKTTLGLIVKLLFAIILAIIIFITIRITAFAAEKWTYLGEFTITCYCSCSKCCGTGKNAGKVTASGTTPTRFRTAAAPKSIPFGTRLYIDTFGQRVVEDRGSAVKGKHIDVYTIDHKTAQKYGKQKQKVWRIE